VTKLRFTALSTVPVTFVLRTRTRYDTPDVPIVTPNTQITSTPLAIVIPEGTVIDPTIVSVAPAGLATTVVFCAMRGERSSAAPESVIG